MGTDRRKELGEWIEIGKEKVLMKQNEMEEEEENI